MKNIKKISGVDLITLACIALLVSGCTTMPTGRRSGESGDGTRIEKPLSVAASLRFEDIPIPEGFNIIRDQSFIFQDGATRIGMVRYSGRPNANQVITFFKTQMSLYNWDLLNTVEYGNTTMSFAKSNENCVVIIEPLSTKTIIGVVVSPKTGTVSTGFSFGSKKGQVLDLPSKPKFPLTKLTFVVNLA